MAAQIEFGITVRRHRRHRRLPLGTFSTENEEVHCRESILSINEL